MKKLITDTQLEQLRCEVTFDTSKDISVSKWQFINVGDIDMHLFRQTNKGELYKEVSTWRRLTADEINKRFADMEWKKVS